MRGKCPDELRRRAIRACVIFTPCSSAAAAARSAGGKGSPGVGDPVSGPCPLRLAPHMPAGAHWSIRAGPAAVPPGVLSGVADGRGVLTYATIRWGLGAVIVDYASMASAARRLEMSWHGANTAILAAGTALLEGRWGCTAVVSVIGATIPLRIVSKREAPPCVWNRRLNEHFSTIIVALTPALGPWVPAHTLNVILGKSMKTLA